MARDNLPVASGADHVKTFTNRFGFSVRLSKKNHFILQHPETGTTISIPNHAEVKRALLQGQLRYLGISDADYCSAFNSAHRRQRTRR